MENSSRLLKEFNLKVTPQRIAIVEELYHKGHINIDELYASMLSKFPSISLATIYKNVNSMVEKFFISEVKIPNEKSVYELIKEDHSHLVCEKCKKIEDIIIDTSSVLKELESQSKFNVKHANVVFTGVCSQCAK
ncbi:ferric uptake regulator, Fur family [Arcobacter nitrofigilis DSM 7299]|uniref:Ferric uptake regulator, Fur family n=1 Tax=Arcobacter nitrofigilis (strain ATCC 33309 / DSM 7299 / CCUG 15893 / LMG 7604 / NCTC 12251 / CI) TaxID=572480 RepID=D5V0G0_ARCNC|nr:transcriptional repressor [Arcobacter nitrofigilis]ADG93772.1 ferric uptake regulator, Fur family [Arcobacter nitrofigilis DSM 7299]